MEKQQPMRIPMHNEAALKDCQKHEATPKRKQVKNKAAGGLARRAVIV